MSDDSHIKPAPLWQPQRGELIDRIAAGLYIVATPIGNLRDVTLRALDILHSADYILAEDTRIARKLLQHYHIKTPLFAYHDHNALSRIPKIITDLQAGQKIALISDAGTPLVSDPGFKLTRAAITAQCEIFPVPGASAMLAGLVKSGLPSDKFLFAGFLPPKSAARCVVLQDFIALKASLILFETAKRLGPVLKDIETIFGPRQAVIARELTKYYEQARRGTITELIGSIEQDPPRGEIVLIIAPAKAVEKWDERQIIAALDKRVAEIGLKQASAEIAQISGWAKRDVYQFALKSNVQ